MLVGQNNSYVGVFVGSSVGDESETIRIGDLSAQTARALECYIGGIWDNFQPVNGTTVVQVTLDLTNDHLGYDFGPNQVGSAPVQRNILVPRSPLRPLLPAAFPQRKAVLNDKVEKLQATVAQQQKQIEALTAQVQKVSAQLEVSKAAPQTVLK